jgi:hypothetical protein
MRTHKNEAEPSIFKDNVLILLFLFQLYTTMAPLLEKKFHVTIILSDIMQANALASMFIASTFFLSSGAQKLTRHRKICSSLAFFLFAVGMLLVLAKSWLEKGIEPL